MNSYRRGVYPILCKRKNAKIEKDLLIGKMEKQNLKTPITRKECLENETRNPERIHRNFIPERKKEKYSKRCFGKKSKER